MPRLFLLSPASTSGKRAAILLNPDAPFDLAMRLRRDGAPIGELFTFLSGLYFRGKMSYVGAFAATADQVRVITSDRGLVSPDLVISRDDLVAMAAGSVDHRHDPYRQPLLRDAELLHQAEPGREVVLLGSVATDKYVEVLAGIFGDRLLFPTAFAGLGDMSRGGMMLRCAREGRELDYAPVMTTPRRRTSPAPKAVKLAVPTTLEPMEAKPVTTLSTGPDWQYEPKWDGFRCIAYRAGDSVTLMSKGGKPLTRYFPEVVAALAAVPVPAFVLDGELVIAEGKTLSFDQLLQRIHPAASRVARLSVEHPAEYIVFDLLADKQGRSLLDEPLSTRRRELERLAEQLQAGGVMHLSPATDDMRVVERWFRNIGGGLDGIIGKRTDLPYQAGLRTGMEKLKHEWTADCVVGGFRYATGSKQVGSLLLGLYNPEGKLDHVGFLSAIRREERAALTARLEKLIKKPGFTGVAPGGPSRWSSERSSDWMPLAPKLVVEVSYDHFSNGRFRHGTSLVRWRPDKSPRQCTTAQLPHVTKSALTLLD